MVWFYRFPVKFDLRCVRNNRLSFAGHIGREYGQGHPVHEATQLQCCPLFSLPKPNKMVSAVCLGVMCSLSWKVQKIFWYVLKYWRSCLLLMCASCCICVCRYGQRYNRKVIALTQVCSAIEQSLCRRLYCCIWGCPQLWANTSLPCIQVRALQHVWSICNRRSQFGNPWLLCT